MASLLCIGTMFGSLSAVFLMDTVGRKASLLAFSVMSLFIGWTLLMAASQGGPANFYLRNRFKVNSYTVKKPVLNDEVRDPYSPRPGSSM